MARALRPNVRRGAHAALCLAILTLAADAKNSPPMTFSDAQIEPLSWSSLDGWAEDDHAAAFATFRTSCKAMVAARRSVRDNRPMYGALLDVCRKAVRHAVLKDEAAREFFEQNFRLVRVAQLGDTEGFLTGYYEPIIEGSLTPTDVYTVPIYKKPSNLVFSGRSRNAGMAFPSRDAKVGRLVGRRKIVPYYDRGEIEDGALVGHHLEIAYLKSQIDLLFAQIQGSARIKLPDGKILRINYDAHNGYPYTPVGRVLIERGIIPKDELSMARIRDWMAAHPDEANEVRRANKSFVFFRVTDSKDDQEPAGAQGVRLTPGRSIAVDRTLHVYGTPFFIQADLPIEGARPETKFHRLMIAQDTGSAIVGLARADIYFGTGDEAGRIAGRIKQSGVFTMLVPRELDPATHIGHIPLPKPKPAAKISEQKKPSKPVAKAESEKVSSKPNAKDKPRNEAEADGKPARKQRGQE